MKKLLQNNSCEDLKLSSGLNLNTLEIEERPSIDNFFSPPKATTLAQQIPKLPTSKFFPTSRKSNISSGNLPNTQNLSLNSTVSKNCYKTLTSLNSSHNQSLLFKDTSANLTRNSITQDTQSKHIWTNIQLPASPLVVIGKFNESLTMFEKVEILKFPQIWFISMGVKKIEGNGNSANNYGFDDETGDYKVILHDQIAFRFELFEILGKGSFGQVFKVFDHKHKVFCALKIIKNKKRFNQQALVEIDILRQLRKKDTFGSIVQIQSSFSFRNHVCITFELLSMNLYNFLKLNRFQGLSMGLIKRFSLQILQALCILQQSHIIHCDLKPENILLKQPNKSTIKVIDFGSSCMVNKKIYTYIQSRFYRAPEIILGIGYTTSIDMWSFGCILMELFTGFPLFPGENESQQLLFIIELLGPPPVEILAKSSRRKLFFDAENRLKQNTDAKGKCRLPNSKNLEKILQTADKPFISLIQKCLEWNPLLRLTPQEALNCDWFNENKRPVQLRIKPKSP